MVFAGFVCFGAVQLISNQANIYQVNKDIQVVQATINEQIKVNSDLEVQVSELSTVRTDFEKGEANGTCIKRK